MAVKRADPEDILLILRALSEEGSLEREVELVTRWLLDD